jgi:tRNA threonylcarbamoyladenosine modification (KEOPS) complex  Pcc1 subunit
MLSESEILSIIQDAVDYGVQSLNGQKSAMALQIASFWLDGYIVGMKGNITDDDVCTLKATLNNYYFF